MRKTGRLAEHPELNGPGRCYPDAVVRLLPNGQGTGSTTPPAKRQGAVE